ncbi:TPR domain protein [Acidisarcina polymorpha]|uniref:TPR domain protein n=1 Tax=Acidisarcina polymorpha TaxID=2211140 RepID=A0A2Z5FUJ7_9BACT|nr:multiheme c-type cytochrome [Acidisarcina polymorpha]AXC10531.1 TPR domain protein [Acidisarcina polymorpha]
MKSVANQSLVLVLLAAAGVLAAAPVLTAGARPPNTISGGESTPSHLKEPGWWPTKTDSNPKDYAGSEACAGCHEREAGTQRNTSMALAASRVMDTQVLRATANIVLDTPPFVTTISRDKKGSTYTTTRGGEAVAGQILWALGNGTMGRTFILESGGSLFESQLSYYTMIHGLDITPGHVRALPGDLNGAFGLRVSVETAQKCFGCHTTMSSVRRQFEPGHAIPGVTCEACHGPGAKHVAAMRLGRVEEGRAAILNPSSFDPQKLVDYCGACHRTTLDVAAAKDYVPINVRFQPYRLEKSRCWRAPDPRIACTGCHDPHEEVVHSANAYDSKCLGCHALKAPAAAPSFDHAAGKAAACTVGSSQCPSCHMPKYSVPAMHGSFTDHDIRIVRPGDPYPL